MKTSDSPDLAEVLRLVLEHRVSRVWTALPGVVEAYDPSTQRADVRPAVVAFLELADGEEREELPVIPNVPVVMPSGGGFFASFPMRQGDPVLLVFACRDVSSWKAGSGAVTNADDVRKHDLTDAFAFPGGRARGAVIAEADATRLVVGQDNGHQIRIGQGVIDIGTSAGAKEAAALATKTRTEIASLASSFNAFINAVWTPFVAGYNLFLTATATHTHPEGAKYVIADPPTPPGTTAAPTIATTPALPGSAHGTVAGVGSASVNIEV